MCRVGTADVRPKDSAPRSHMLRALLLTGVPMSPGLRVLLAPRAAEGSLQPVAEAVAQLVQDCAYHLDVLAGLDDARPGDHVVWLHDASVPADEEDLVALASLPERVRVLPVVATPPDAASLPAELSKFNAIIRQTFGSAWAAAVADELASRLWLRRRERKVFLSYKRSDSAAIAHQLHDKLIEQRCKVFLDDHSIQWGADFQDELHWELNDVDLVVVLASPHLTHSTWVMEELTTASEREIGLLCVTWPATSGAAPSMLDNVYPDDTVQLEPGDLTEAPHPSQQTLTDEALQRVCRKLYETRAIAIAGRSAAQQPHLQRVLQEQRQVAELQPAEEQGDYLCQWPEAGTTRAAFVRMLPFRPGPDELYALERQAPKHAELTVCIYPENSPDDARAAGLRWLFSARRGDVRAPKHHLLLAAHVSGRLR